MAIAEMFDGAVSRETAKPAATKSGIGRYQKGERAEMVLDLLRATSRWLSSEDVAAALFDGDGPAARCALYSLMRKHLHLIDTCWGRQGQRMKFYRLKATATHSAGDGGAAAAADSSVEGGAAAMHGAREGGAPMAALTQPYAADLPCITCRRVFRSSDRRSNRMCDPCRTGARELAPLALAAGDGGARVNIDRRRLVR